MDAPPNSHFHASVSSQTGGVSIGSNTTPAPELVPPKGFHAATGAGDNFTDLHLFCHAMLAYWTAREDAARVFEWMEIMRQLGMEEGK